jgi:uncharacterized membrane protein YedE/YeeE
MNVTLLNLTSGALIAGYLLAGLYFFKFWKASRDALFIWFATAFWLLAGQRLLLSLSRAPVEDQIQLFVVRLVAYLLFLIAIVNKNLKERGQPVP